MDLVVMAAGMGSRFGGLKQIQPIDNDENFIIDYSVYDAMTLLIADCSIRTSTDQYLLAIPRSFSQLTASFFGSQCQGILPALLLA